MAPVWEISLPSTSSTGAWPRGDFPEALNSSSDLILTSSKGTWNTSDENTCKSKMSLYTHIAKDQGETGDFSSPEVEVEVVVFDHRHAGLFTLRGIGEKMLRFLGVSGR